MNDPSVERSNVRERFEQVRTRLERAVSNATVVRAGTRVGTTLGRATDESRLASVGRTLERYVRASWCYRWLTAEPDPDVIVIDLRETWTVGPVLRLLDRFVDPLAAVVRSSQIADIGEGITDAPLRAVGLVASVAVLVNLVATLAFGSPTTSDLGVRVLLLGVAALLSQVRLSAAELAETRAGRVLRAILEPPPSSERRDDAERAADEDERD